MQPGAEPDRGCVAAPSRSVCSRGGGASSVPTEHRGTPMATVTSSTTTVTGFGRRPSRTVITTAAALAAGTALAIGAVVLTPDAVAPTPVADHDALIQQLVEVGSIPAATLATEPVTSSVPRTAPDHGPLVQQLARVGSIPAQAAVPTTEQRRQQLVEQLAGVGSIPPQAVEPSELERHRPRAGERRAMSAPAPRGGRPGARALGRSVRGERCSRPAAGGHDAPRARPIGEETHDVRGRAAGCPRTGRGACCPHAVGEDVGEVQRPR